eukprot:763918-Hanusia_phi.AAC.1
MKKNTSRPQKNTSHSPPPLLHRPAQLPASPSAAPPALAPQLHSLAPHRRELRERCRRVEAVASAKADAPGACTRPLALRADAAASMHVRAQRPGLGGEKS